MEEHLRIFHIEATELLDEMEASLMRLEKSPTDTEAINSIFRAAHTLKGSAGIVGLDEIEDFTHKLESLLDQIRSGQVVVNSKIIELLFECRDHTVSLVSMINGQGAAGKDIDSTHQRLSEILTYLTEEDETGITGTLEPDSMATGQADNAGGKRSSSPNWHISLRFGPDTLRNGMDPISFIKFLDHIGETEYLRTLWESMPAADDMDPESCYLGFEIDLRSTADRQAVEEVFEFLEDDCLVRIIEPHSPVATYLDLLATLPEDRHTLQRIFIEGGSLTPEDVVEAAALASSTEQTKDTALSMDTSDRTEDETSISRTSTIRVGIDKLDRLVDIVGELVISGASIKQEANTLHNRRLEGLTHTLLRLIEEVRDSAMSVRMTPIQEIFNRLKRVVRDISIDLNREVDLSISGGETELDRTVIERIKDPLVHIIRNAIDHGMEPSEERVSKGKPPRGNLLLNAYQETGDIVIEVSDDGRGLDHDAILKRAIQKGLAQEGSKLTDTQVLDFVFEPGFSTKKEVTNISGRGVGMDVVKRNISALKGTVEMDSTLDKGTTVRIKLPLTLAIIDGFMVTVGDTSFVVPMDMVVECLELTKELRQEAHGRNHINLRGSILPYINLRSMFNINSAQPEHEHILMVRHSGNSVGLLVDRLVGETSTVIKSLDKLHRNVRGISGATIQGDGTVALIIDVPDLVRQATKNASDLHG